MIRVKADSLTWPAGLTWAMGLVLGALAARRKPLQDSPTPAGNPMAAIALFRLYAYTNDARYRDLAEGTLKAFAGIAAHYGLFASTYGIALGMYLHPHTQVVIVGSGARAEQLEAAALKKFVFKPIRYSSAGR